MDWFSWLSKTGLEPTLIYEYGLLFARNELEEGDISYLNHEFLQSMGISIAKHRLEILKLARKESGRYPQPVSRILIAIKRTKRCFSKYLRPPWAQARARDDSALALVPLRSYSARWKGGALLRRNKRMALASRSGNLVGRAPLLLTNGSPTLFHSSRIDSFSSPWMSDRPVEAEEGDRKEVEEGEDCDEYWSPAVEDIKWDAMFQNLKPT
ncbi:hypothetical protein AAHA92_07286 [Salvia divinorum]|uniref:SAM domain-containing protein n=1 Tax=Salvia divinorum TaxID=28513 RepID=A0ABD1IBZ6_SALDI